MLSPEWLNKQADHVQKYRTDMLFDDDSEALDDICDDPEAAEYYLIALALLDQAHRNLRLATLKQRQMIARAQGGPR